MKQAQTFGIMALAVILGLIAGKFISKGIAATGLVKIAAGNANSQGRTHA